MLDLREHATVPQRASGSRDRLSGEIWVQLAVTILCAIFMGHMLPSDGRSARDRYRQSLHNGLQVYRS